MLKHFPDKDFYASREWREVRYQALLASQGCCECCGGRPRPGNPLHVDHIKPRSTHPALELKVSNLQVLCEECNLGKSNWDETDWRVQLVQYLTPEERLERLLSLVNRARYARSPAISQAIQAEAWNEFHSITKLLNLRTRAAAAMECSEESDDHE